MRTFIELTLLILLLAAGAWEWSSNKTQYRAALRTANYKLFPCSSPITYSLGSIDTLYNIQPAQFAAYIKEAEDVWERAFGKDFFQHVPTGGDVTISLVYDQRQAAMDKLKGLGFKTDQSLSSYKALKARYDELLARVGPRQAAAAARMGAYKRGEGAYNAMISAYNQRGSAPARQVRYMDSARRALEREFNAVKKMEQAVNADIDVLNALATTLNQLIVELNLNVDQYNREGAALGVFEEGLYTITGGVRAIDIYKYSDRHQLVRLLAHEMGHALGLDHVENPDAMMYPVNRGDSLAILPDDAGELARACAPPYRRKPRLPENLRSGS
jgi:hypothetical protein